MPQRNVRLGNQAEENHLNLEGLMLLSLIYKGLFFSCEANFSTRMREKYALKWRLENLQR